MFNFGDELILHTFRIPWLIWIQLIIVLLLLLAFFFCFTVLASSDLPSPDTVAAASASSTVQPLVNHHSTVITNSLRSTRGVENLSVKGVARSASRGIVREEVAVASEGEASSSPLYFLHPCYYFNLARVAFLKCFGLDSMTESDSPPPTQKHMKKKES